MYRNFQIVCIALSHSAACWNNELIMLNAW